MTLPLATILALWLAAAAWPARTTVQDAEPALVLVQTLRGSDPRAFAFGEALVVDRDTLVVGAPESHEGEGSVFVFEHREGSWSETALLLSPDGDSRARERQGMDGFELIHLSREHSFGQALALEGGRLVVGEPGESFHELAGAVHVFERTDDGWEPSARLVPARSSGNDWFGEALALAGDTLVVGAPGDGSGSAHHFEHAEEGWTLAGGVPAPWEASDHFAGAVALSLGTLFLSDLPGRNVGAVRLFDGPGGQHFATLRSPDAAELGFFGACMVADGETVVVGAWQGGDREHDGGGGPGAAYVYEQSPAGDWSMAARLAPPGSRPHDKFGWALAVRGDTIAVGAPSWTRDSRVHLFERRLEGYVHAGELIAPAETEKSSFGQSVALTDDCLFVGDPLHPGGGRVHVYRR